MTGLIPSAFGTYFEPFVGGGALFFHIQPSAAVLGDTNSELINCYQQVRDCPRRIISYLSELKNTEDEYYRIRDSSPDELAARAARLIYLTTLSFNGIYRENLQGQFNVPYGRKYHLNPCEPEKILATSKSLEGAKLFPWDFERTLAAATQGDLVYLDPPYTVAHANNGFIKYNSRIFSWEDQVRLANLAKDLLRRGCRVLISNADHPSVRQLYSDFSVLVLERPSVIAASREHRREVTECVFYG